MLDGTHNPFVGLKPFGPKDRQRLYGRDKDLILIKDRIFSARTTLLFAGSGVGKTSFLNAKVIPELQRQYSVAYHKEWATDEPLVALARTLATQFPSPDGSRVRQSGATRARPLLEQLSAFRRDPAEITGGGTTPRCLLVLDQFEEIFQYHSSEQYFVKFIEELSTVINTSECNARVLFAMREEFLGELSVFDNNIPDLFNNYYRLKCPNKAEAEEIIQRTCSFAGVDLDSGGLEQLVVDLAKIERGKPVASTVPSGNGSVEAFVEGDIVAPPYLQIACQRLWDLQFPSKKDVKQSVTGAASAATVAPKGDTVVSQAAAASVLSTVSVSTSGVSFSTSTSGEQLKTDVVSKATAGPTFLATYKVGLARKMLKGFCQEKLLSFTARERALLADAFDFLVTKKGAKIAYELGSLADHMQVDEERLKLILLRLSRPDSRILSVAKGRSDGALWFELYHDMYGSIIDEWKRNYRLEKKQALQRMLKLIGMLLGVIVMVAVLMLSFRHWYVEPQHYDELLRAANLQDPAKYAENYSAFIKMRDTLGFEPKARRMWAAAWKRRAQLAEAQENGPEALVSWLTAASEGPAKEAEAALAEAGMYLDNPDFKSLRATVRFEGAFGSPGVNPPMFSSDGKTLLIVSNDLRVVKWDTQSGRLMAQSQPLQLDDSRNPRDGRPPDANPPQSRQLFIRAAAGNLLGGFDQGKFYLWKADTSTPIWSATRAGQTPPSRPKASARSGGSVENYPGGNYGPLAATASVSLSPDGHYFATLDEQGAAQICEVDAAENTVRVSTSIGSVRKLKFSPDNKTLVILFDNQKLQLRNLKTGSVQTETAPPSTRDISFSPDGTRFILQGADYDFAQIRSGATGALLGKTNQLVGAGASVSFLADNKTIAVCDLLPGINAFSIKYSNADTGNVLASRVIPFENFSAYYFSPDGESILTTTDSGAGRLWNATLQLPDGKIIRDSSPLVRAILSGNGRVLGTLNSKNETRIWNADDAGELGQIGTVADYRSNQSITPGPYDPYLRDLTLSNDGRYVCIRASRDATKSLTLWDRSSNREVPIVPSEKRLFGPAAFSLSNEAFAIAAPDNTIRLWKDFAGQNPQVITWNQKDLVRALAFSSDARYLVALFDSSERSVGILDVNTGKDIPLPDDGHSTTVNVLSLGRNGKLIGVLSRDHENSVVLYDLTTGTSQGLAHPAAVTSVAFTREGRNLAVTGCVDGSVLLWDADSGKMIGSGAKFGGRVRTVRISSDGKTALVFSDQWIHSCAITDKGLEYRAARLRTGLYSTPRLLNPEGTRFRSVNVLYEKSAEIDDISLNPAGGNSVAVTNALSLLESWKERLGLNVDDRSGQLVPRIPVPKSIPPQE